MARPYHRAAEINRARTVAALMAGVALGDATREALARIVADAEARIPTADDAERAVLIRNRRAAKDALAEWEIT